MSQALTRKQKAALADEVISSAVEMVVARQEAGVLADELAGVEWDDMAAQMAVWFRRLPGGGWHMYLPAS